MAPRVPRFPLCTLIIDGNPIGRPVQPSATRFIKDFINVAAVGNLFRNRNWDTNSPLCGPTTIRPNGYCTFFSSFFPFFFVLIIVGFYFVKISLFVLLSREVYLFYFLPTLFYNLLLLLKYTNYAKNIWNRNTKHYWLKTGTRSKIIRQIGQSNEEIWKNVKPRENENMDLYIWVTCTIKIFLQLFKINPWECSYTGRIYR